MPQSTFIESPNAAEGIRPSAERKPKTLPAADPSSVGSLNLREKASYCRRLAKAATDSDLARALLELADEFEQAAFDSIGPIDLAPSNRKTPKRR